MVVEVFDPVERELPPVGLIQMEDAETGRRRMVDTSSSRVRRAFAGEARRRREEVHLLLRRVGVDLVSLDVSRPYDLPLVRFFRERAARRAAA